MKRFNSAQLAHYLCLREIWSDKGGFMAEFMELCDNMGFKKYMSSSGNPHQFDVILERIQQVLADCLRSFSLDQHTINTMNDDLLKNFKRQCCFKFNAAVIRHIFTSLHRWCLEETCRCQQMQRLTGNRYKKERNWKFNRVSFVKTQKEFCISIRKEN